MQGLLDAATEQAAAGHGLLATVGVGDTLALGRYYLFGTGRCVPGGAGCGAAAARAGRPPLAACGREPCTAAAHARRRNPTEILTDFTGWDVHHLLGEANITVAGLQQVGKAGVGRRRWAASPLSLSVPVCPPLSLVLRPCTHPPTATLRCPRAAGGAAAAGRRFARLYPAR